MDDETTSKAVEAGSPADKTEYPLFVTEYEAKLIMDSFKITNSVTESIARKAARLVVTLHDDRLVGTATQTAEDFIKHGRR